MKPFIAFVLTKLFILDVVCGYLLYKLTKQKGKTNQDEQDEEKQLIARLQEGIDKYNSEAKRLEKLYRERKRMYNPCNYGGHEWEVDGETDVQNVCGDYCKHYYHYVCKRCGKRRTTTKPVISRWEDEE